jgi:moderate conductance mechanosensitive channel
MLEVLREILPAPGTFSYYLLRGALTFLICVVVARVLGWLIWHVEVSRLVIRQRRFSKRRRETLRDLIRSLMNGLAVLVTIVIVLGMFVPPSALITAIGLFSAGLGIAARPYISDFLGGIVLLFEDQFALDDKVEIGDRNVMGVVERVALRTIHIRGESGELWIVPNGDVRTIRNFTRGSFSPANIRVTVPSARLDETLALLADLVATPRPDVIEPPEIISEAGEIGETTVLMLKVKARYGQGSEVRRQLLADVQQMLIGQHGVGHADGDDRADAPREHPPSKRPTFSDDLGD